MCIIIQYLLSIIVCDIFDLVCLVNNFQQLGEICKQKKKHTHM